MPYITKLAILCSILSVGIAAAEPAVNSDAGADPVPAWDMRALDIETGLLWQIGTLTPINYRLVPTQFSWRSRALLGHQFADGSRIVARHRLTLIATWVAKGPESRYFGFSGSPSIEWWNRAGTRSVFFGSGGGFGFIDSRNVPGGQGQDFTFNWFIRAGVEIVTSRKTRLTAGMMYQHLSNLGMTNPNPGIDALGFTIGYGWSR